VIVQRPLGRSGIRTSELGMGCNRLGSLLVGGGRRRAARAVEAALEEGIRFFDTADIYGQGDSERVLGQVLGRAQTVTIATKAGYRLPAPMWALRLAKPPLRLASRFRTSVARSLAARRSQGYAQCFEPEHLARALHGSLKRLGRDRVDLFLLHNPPPGLAASDALWRLIDDEKRAGGLRSFGVSCTGTEADIVWLHHSAVEIVEVPVGPSGESGSPAGATDAFLACAASRGVGVIARELLGGPGRHDEAAVESALRGALTLPSISVAQLGMSRPEHVRANAALARRIAAESAVALRA
jgi:aryl-alcohol dehydrogenase-like predicted oxidoreductase